MSQKSQMNYSLRQLSGQRWGIYVENKLLATLGCHKTGLKVLEFLQNKNRLRKPHQVFRQTIKTAA